MTIHKLPVREVPETPEETAYFDAKTWEKPVKPTYSMLYKQHKFVVGIVVGCLVMSIVY